MQFNGMKNDVSDESWLEHLPNYKTKSTSISSSAQIRSIKDGLRG